MLNVSIVLYKTPMEEVAPLVAALRQNACVDEIFLVDNSPTRDERFATLQAAYIFNGRNLGYGRAHNIAIRKTLARGTAYHLVMNSDIRLMPDTIDKSLRFMQENPDVGLLMPQVFCPDGEIQHLCKLLPTPFDLFARRFLPRGTAQKRIERFELRQSGYNRTMDVPYLSGCFMLLRSEALRRVGLFDERFFMYPEDIDLSRRLHANCRTVFYPEAAIVHEHRQGSYKSGRLLWVHMREMVKYFNKWGWFCDKERAVVNRKTLEAIRQMSKI